MEQVRYIHFEGMDLAGKTTATQGFIAADGGTWEIRRNSIATDNPIYLLADSLRRADAYDAETLGNLFVAALMADIRSFVPPTADTIQDSTILLRSLAYHSVRGTPRIPQVLQDMVPEHPQFTASFLFTASIDRRRERLQQRMQRAPEEVAPEDLMVLDAPEKFLAMEARLIDLSTGIFHSVVIDTTSLTPEMVVESIQTNMPSRRE